MKSEMKINIKEDKRGTRIEVTKIINGEEVMFADYLEGRFVETEILELAEKAFDRAKNRA